MDNHHPAPEGQIGTGTAQAPQKGTVLRGDSTPYGKPWTEEELKVLREFYPNRCAKEIAELVKRTPGNITKKAHAIGLHKRRYWTEKERKFLKERYPTTPNQELGRMIGRTASAVKHEGIRLGIQKNPYFKSLFFVRPSRVKKIPDNLKGYVACAIDGEGTILIGYSSSNIPRPRICIGNTNEPFIQFLRKVIGTGTVYKTKKRQNPKWKLMCSLQLYAIQDIKSLLEQIRDFLIIKRKNAELVLRFIEIHTSVGYSPEMDEIYKEIRHLNKRGKA